MSVSHQFQTLDKLVESAAQLCKNGASSEIQVGAMLSVCEELQHILRYAFIENGFLANRIEGLVLHHKNTVENLERRIKLLEAERKIAQRQIKRLRKGYTELNGAKRLPWNENRWGVAVKCSDYDSLTTISRIAGNPDLEYMLRLNQIMINFVKDKQRDELPLPTMGSEERSELSKLASLYRLRMKCGKTNSVASVVLTKGRNTGLPNSGEVDGMLSRFTKSSRHFDTSVSMFSSSAGTERKPSVTSIKVHGGGKEIDSRAKISSETTVISEGGVDTRSNDSSSTCLQTRATISSGKTTSLKTSSSLDINANILNLLVSSASKQSTSVTTQTPQVALLYSNPPSSLQGLGQKAIPIIIRRTSPNTPPVIQLAPSTTVASQKTTTQLHYSTSSPTSSTGTGSSVECAKIADTSALVNILAQQLIGKDIQQLQTTKATGAASTGSKRSQDFISPSTNSDTQPSVKKQCESSTDEEIIKVD